MGRDISESPPPRFAFCEALQWHASLFVPSTRREGPRQLPPDVPRHCVKQRRREGRPRPRYEGAHRLSRCFSAARACSGHKQVPLCIARLSNLRYAAVSRGRSSLATTARGLQPWYYSSSYTRRLRHFGKEVCPFFCRRCCTSRFSTY